MTHPVARGTEALFQQQVEQLAGYYGWRFFHAPDNRPVRSRRGRTYVQDVKAGFPDLVLVRGPELVFAELKTDTGRIKAEQTEWITDLQAVSASVTALAEHAQDQPRMRRLIAAHGLPCVEVYLWRPADFDEIVERLARGRHLVRPDYLPPVEGAA